MSATVIGTVESAKVAQKAIDELLKAGFKDQDVEILEGDEDEIVAVIVERGFDEDDARGYAKAVSRGKTGLRRVRSAPRPRRPPPSSSGTRPPRKRARSWKASRACPRSRRRSRSARARSRAAGFA